MNTQMRFSQGRIIIGGALVLLSIFLFGFLRIQATQVSNVPSVALPIAPTSVHRAALSNDLIYLLYLQDTTIKSYSMISGAPAQELDISGNGVVPLMRSVQDFIIDTKGNMHILAFVMPMKESGIIRYDRAKADYSWLRLSRPVYAYHIEMDSQSNYYLLGFDSELSESLASGRTVAEKTNIVHKFSFDGQYIASFLPVNSPSRQEFAGFLASVVARSNFVVSSDNEVYYLQREINASVRASNARGIVYRAREDSPVTIFEPSKPENCWLAGIHKYNDQLALEWAEMGAVMSRRVTRKDGSNIALISEAQILAMKEGIIAALTPVQATRSFAISFIAAP